MPSGISRSNLVIRPFEVVQAELPAVGAILVGLAAGGEAYAPAGSNHHPAHLVAQGRAERRVGEVGLGDLGLCDLVFGDAEPPRQILARAPDRLLHAVSHSFLNLPPQVVRPETYTPRGAPAFSFFGRPAAPEYSAPGGGKRKEWTVDRSQLPVETPFLRS